MRKEVSLVERISKRLEAQAGSTVVEMLVAVGILTMFLAAVIMLSFANQNEQVDTDTSDDALASASRLLEDARATSRKDLGLVVASTDTSDPPYTKTLSILDDEQCKKIVQSRVSWSLSPLRMQNVQLTTALGDVVGALALGGDCNFEPPRSPWSNPIKKCVVDTLNPGKSTALDVFNEIAYLGQDKSPFLSIADTRGFICDPDNPKKNLFVTFSNGFDAGNTINAIDVIEWLDPITGTKKTLAFSAMDSTTNQLEVIDVTDIANPVLIASRTLSACVTGSFPEGWRLFVFGQRLYFVTRETAGPELHLFNIADPTNPLEIGVGACKGRELNDTVNGISVRDQIVSGSTRRFVYFATDESDKEIRVFEVTGDVVSEVVAANQNLPGAQDGRGIYSIGNKLYFGRDATASGPELYVFNAINPPAGLTLLGSRDIGTGVKAIRVAGMLAFLATAKSNQEFQVWNISNPSSITQVNTYNFGNIIDGGIDYEPDFVYSTGNSTPNFQKLYSP